MDYKKIFRSRKMRLKLLRMLSFVPDKQMLQIQYRIKIGKKLDLHKPLRFTEKLQWYKLYYKNSLMIQCVDKYDVREYVTQKGLGSILIPCYGVYNCVKEIKWNTLPNEFVLKDTLGGGGTSVIVVKDKNSIDLKKVVNKIEGWTNINAHVKSGGREWPYYSGKKHRIIIEKFLNSNQSKEGLIDYKFFCFNGKVEFLYVMGKRKIGDSVQVSILDRHFNLLHVKRVGDKLFENLIKPSNYEDMIKIAETLAKDFPHVRVDLYNHNGNILFGELTFYNASGYMKYEPDYFDYTIGKKFVLPRNTN